MKTSNKYLSLCMLCFIIILGSATEVDAQRKKRKQRETTTEESTTRRSRSGDEVEMSTPFKNKLVYEIGVGNIGFFGIGSSSQFAISAKPSVGYKIFDRWTAGIYGKADYFFINRQSNDDSSLLDLGVGVYSRFKIVDAFYLKAEYGLQSYSYEIASNFIIEERKNFIVPFIGAGYAQGFGAWKFGGEIMLNMDGEARDYNNKFLEYWIKIDYNF